MEVLESLLEPFRRTTSGHLLLNFGDPMNKILIVDDQACVRQLLTAELILGGYHVTSASDVESARERLSFFEPDLVLLDLYLDGPEEFRLLEDIKTRYPELPVIIFTAYDGFTDDPRLSKADGYVLKSFDLHPLKQKIADVLNRNRHPEVKKEVESWHRISGSPSIEPVKTCA
jgi:DNA-binding NtrC family response regulator